MANANDATAQVRLSSARRDQWDKHAEKVTDGNRSDFIKSMVEAGRKKFDAEVEPNEPTDDVRRERNRLRRENEQLREENERLYDRLDTAGTRGAIVSYLRERGDATFDQLLEHVSGGVTERVNEHIDAMRSDGELGVSLAPEHATPDKHGYEPGEPMFYLKGDETATDRDRSDPSRSVSEGFDEIAEGFDPERTNAIHLYALQAHEARKRDRDREPEESQ